MPPDDHPEHRPEHRRRGDGARSRRPPAGSGPSRPDSLLHVRRRPGTRREPQGTPGPHPTRHDPRSALVTARDALGAIRERASVNLTRSQADALALIEALEAIIRNLDEASTAATEARKSREVALEYREGYADGLERAETLVRQAIETKLEG